MKRYPYFLTIIAIVIGAASATNATNIIPSSLEYMTGFSDTIITGYVKDKYSYWEGDKIYTNVSIAVEEFTKNVNNEQSSMIEIKVLGGQVGDTRFEVNQSPVFTIDEKILLFLKNINNTYIIYGFNYGAYKITWDEVQKKEFIDGPLFHKETHFNPQTMQQTANTNLYGKQELSIFLNKLKRYIK